MALAFLLRKTVGKRQKRERTRIDIEFRVFQRHRGVDESVLAGE